MSKLTKIGVIAVLSSSVLFQTACSNTAQDPTKNPTTTTNPPATTTQAPTTKPTVPPTTEPPAPPVYTYREYNSASPSSWNSHIGKTDTDEYVQMYTEMGLYAMTLNEDFTSYAFSEELAVGDPVDVTADYVGKYGIEEDESAKAYKINLNTDATWANGEKITATDYVYSMEQLLSPAMKNSRASDFYNGTGEIYNAANFYMSSDVPDAIRIGSKDIYSENELNALIDAGQLFFAADKINLTDPAGGYTIQSYYDTFLARGNNTILARFHKNKNLEDENVLETLNKLPKNSEGYTQVTRENLATIKDCLGTFTGNMNMASIGLHWYNVCAIAKKTLSVYTREHKNEEGAYPEYTDEQIEKLMDEGKLYFAADKTALTDTDGGYTIQSYYDTFLARGNNTILARFHKNKDLEDENITSGNIYFKGYRIGTGDRTKKELIKQAKKDLKANLIGKEENATRIASIRTELKNAKNEVKNANNLYMKQTIEHLKGELSKSPNDKELKEKLRLAKRERLTTKIQMIFQDPIASLNPRMTVRETIAEGLIIKGIKDKKVIEEAVNKALDLVGLVPEHADRYPHEFSGGQRQRIGIARAIIMNPDLMIADEPVSALDVSIQAQVINLLNKLRKELGLTVLFIAHDLSVVKYFSDRIGVMYFGKMVELADADELFAHPMHPYTKALLSAIPLPDPDYESRRTRLTYNPLTAHNYENSTPSFREVTKDHFVLCDDAEEAVLREKYGL